jgi:hypothetical protein
VWILGGVFFGNVKKGSAAEIFGDPKRKHREPTKPV